MRRLFLILSSCLVFRSILPAQTNETQSENLNPGTTDWQITQPATNREIEGYASLTSVNRGGTISFFVGTAESSYTLDVFRTGWYGGAGARRIMSTVTRAGVIQPMPPQDPNTGLAECNWTNPYVLTIPSTWISGVYLVKLTGLTSGLQSYIVFVVREDSRRSAVLFQTSVTTYAAYNNWPGPNSAGRSLYDFNSTPGAAYKVSFNRPYYIDNDLLYANLVGSGFYLRWEYNMVRWMEREGYDVTYITNLDTHENPAMLLNHKTFLSVGHDEYWSWNMRAAVEAARDQGVGIGFFSANTCYWQIRLDPSTVNASPDRTLVGYKEHASLDPVTNQCYLTTQWRLNTCKPSEQALIGVEYNGVQPVNASMVITNPTHWSLTGTGISAGTALPGLIGYESDGIVDNNSPAGTITIAHSPVSGSIYSDMVSYTAASGATVFSSGTMQLTWGLDDWGVPSIRSSRLSPAIQQIARNVLARLASSSVQTGQAPVSDDFNSTTLNASLWTFVNPVGDGAVSLNGTHALLSVPAGTSHDVWPPANLAARIMQSIGNVDFQVEVKFDSIPAAFSQMQGIIVEQDSNNYLRVDVYSDGTTPRLFAATIVNNSATIQGNIPLTALSGSLWLRLTRAGANWTAAWSRDGTTYNGGPSFTQSFTVSKIGPFAANCCGSTSPAFSASVDYFFNTASPIGGAPQLSGVSASPSSTQAVITWTSDVSSTSQVVYGITPTYGSSSLRDSTLVTAHSVTLPGLACGTTYHYQALSSTSSATGTSPDATFTTTSCGTSGGPVSDDFNATTLNSSLWTFVNPVGDGSVSLNGTHALLSVPASTSHDVWPPANLAGRIMQSIGNVDFQVEVKFDSIPAAFSQMQGIIVEQDSNNYLRLDVYSDGSTPRLFAATIVNNSATIQGNIPLTALGGSLWLRLTRAGANWTATWSRDGTTYNGGPSFTQGFTVSKIGPFAANCCGATSPAFTASVDYFVNTASPIGGAPHLSGVSAAPSSTQAVITWTTDVSSTSQVVYGTTQAYGSSSARDSTLVTTHSVTVPGLACSNTYHYQAISSTSSATGTSPDATFTTTSCGTSGGPTSDNFNSTTLNSLLWTFVNPVGDGSVSLNGTHALLRVPAGTPHDVWPPANLAARIMQSIGNVDFQVEVKFDSVPAVFSQMQGIIVEQDSNNYLRVDFYHDGSTPRLFAASIVNNVAAIQGSIPLSGLAASLWLRLTRAGGNWSATWSRDGTTFNNGPSFSQTLVVTKIGPFAANCCGSPSPAFIASLDYFFNTASPLVP